MSEQIYFNNKEYSYLPDYNILLNSDIERIVKKYGKKVEKQRVLLNETLVKENVKRINAIIFELTQDCNLRCKYCIYSGKFYFHRIYNKKNLSFSIAKQVINYFYDLLKLSDEKEIGFGFYGGEPLLNFYLMKKIVNYVEKKFYGWKIHYTLSTNGTLLHKKDIIKYMISKEFDMRISIDGPEKNHDAYRVYINGKGTFERIIRNLRFLYEKYAKYFLEHISIGVTHSPELSLLDIYNFFDKEDMFKDTRSISVGDVNSINSELYNNGEDYASDRSKEEDEIFKQIIRKVKRGKKLSAIDKAFIKIHDIREYIGKTIYFYSQNTCLFNSRVFIDVEGHFHICEKGNSKFIIGDYENGYNYKKMVNIYHDFENILVERCSECDYKFFCNLCFASIENNGNFSFPENYCEGRKDFIKYSMERYIKLNQEGVFEYEKKK